MMEIETKNNVLIKFKTSQRLWRVAHVIGMDNKKSTKKNGREATRHKTSKKEKYNLNVPVGRRSHENESYWLERDDYGMKIKDYICRTD